MARSTTDYSAIAAAAPVNRQAALMRDGGGEHYAPETSDHMERWDAPPPQERRPPPDLPRLEGRTFGDGMRVVRYHGTRWNGARWLVRCRCGSYELRSTKAVTTSQADHRCGICSRTRSLALNLERDRTDPNWRAARPDTFKMKWTEAELRFALAHAETAHGSDILPPDERAELARRIRERLSGISAA